MPSWRGISRDFSGWWRRYGFGRSGFFETLDGLLPVSVVDRHWEGRDAELFGVTTTCQCDPGNLTYANCGLLANERDVWVRKITAHYISYQPLQNGIYYTQGYGDIHSLIPPTGAEYSQPQQFHLTTWRFGVPNFPDLDPNPFQFNPLTFVSGLNLSRAFSVPSVVPASGRSAGLPLFLGPRHQQVLQGSGKLSVGPGVGIWNNVGHMPGSTTILDWKDPPVRVLPGRNLVLGCVFLPSPLLAGWPAYLFVSWFFTEREPQEDPRLLGL